MECDSKLHKFVSVTIASKFVWRILNNNISYCDSCKGTQNRDHNYFRFNMFGSGCTSIPILFLHIPRSMCENEANPVAIIYNSLVLKMFRTRPLWTSKTTDELSFKLHIKTLHSFKRYTLLLRFSFYYFFIHSNWIFYRVSLLLSQKFCNAYAFLFKLHIVHTHTYTYI